MYDARDVCVVIPAYNEGDVIGSVVQELIGRAYRVVVVDDGSIDVTGQEARAAGAFVVRHPINRGQGAALMTGLQVALRFPVQAIVTFDADGQHRVEDIERLVNGLRHYDVVLGSRFLGRAHDMGAVRSIVLRTAARLGSWSTGQRMTDAHNFLRAMRRTAAESLHLRQDRMAHASELVSLLTRHGLSFGEVPVEIRYTPYSRRKGQTLAGAVDIVVDLATGWWRRT